MLLSLLAACGTTSVSTPPEEPPPSPPTETPSETPFVASMRLLESGSEPRFTLPGPTFESGRSYTLRQLEKRFRPGSQDLELELVVRSVAEDQRWALVVRALRDVVADADLDPAWHLDLPLVDQRVQLSVDPASGAITAEGPLQVVDDVRERLVEMAEALAIAVPQEPVGVGARWETLIRRQVAGARVQEHAIWTVSQRVDGNVELSMAWSIVPSTEHPNLTGRGDGSALIGGRGLESIQRTGMVFNPTAADPDARAMIRTAFGAGMRLPLLPD